MSADKKNPKAVKLAKSGSKEKNLRLDLAQFMGHQYLCRSLKVSEINTLLKYLTLRQFNEGDILADIGEVGDALYLVVQGEIALMVDDKKKHYEIVREGPGEMLGIMSFFDRKPRSVRLVAKAPDTQVLRLSRAMYKRMKVEHPFIAINLVEHALINLDCLFRKVSKDFAQFAHHLYGEGGS
ncbi:MAG: cyclic nucleotide-binding domain-containing protein [Sulfurimicrobium sp.]|nr:cyclic nucleotide-binding domain-containing protein [Sulfurimicrobium sp.]